MKPIVIDIVDEFLVPYQVREILEDLDDYVFVAGGAARYVFMGDNAPAPHDIDLFLYQKGYLAKAQTELTKLGYVAVEEQEHNTVYEHDDYDLKVQLIHSGWGIPVGTPSEIIQGFAFNCECFALSHDSSGYWIEYTRDAENDTLHKRLRVNYIACPVHVAWRAVKKYGPKGFTMSGYEMLKLFQDWDKRDYKFKIRTAETVLREYIPEGTTVEDALEGLGL